VSTSTPTDFGRDLAGTITLSTARTVAGQELYVNAMVRRITTPRGKLYFHRNYGIDVRQLLGQGTAPGDLRKHAADIVAEIENDPRTLRSTVAAQITESKDSDGTSTLAISVSGYSTRGPFDFVVTVDKVTFAILKIQTGATL
jgi:hypothetical protein